MNLEAIPIKNIYPNRGQIDGVPANPRTWSKEDVAKLASSIAETPEEFVSRPLLVYEIADGNYIVLSGNMRLDAAKMAKMDIVPCHVFGNLTPRKIKEIIIKANSSFGSWDVDELANGEWSNEALEDWGVSGIAGVEVAGYSEANKEINTDEWSENMKFKFKFQPEDYGKVKGHFDGKDARVELLKLVGYGE